MSWFAGGPAMAKDGALADACRAQSHNITAGGVTGHDVTGPDLTGGLTTLPAAGVLSIADAAGAAAGQGHNALPTGSATVAKTLPAPAALPAVPGPRSLPGTASGATSALPAPASAAKTLPTDATTLSAPAKAVTAPVHGAVAGASAVADRRTAAVPAADAKTLFPARSAVPLLAAAPAKPSAANGCARQALRTAPAAREREHPVAQGHPKKGHRNPKPQDQPAGAASRGSAPQQPRTQQPGTQQPGTQQPGTQKPGAQKPGTQKPGQGPEGRDQGAQGSQGGLAPQGVSHSTSSQSGASSQEQSTKTFPVKDRRHRKAHHPRKQPGAAAPAQAANQAGQAGRPMPGTRNTALAEGERVKGAKDKRQRNDAARGRGTAVGVEPDIADGRHVPRLRPREYPRAASHQPNRDITAPAALTKVTGTRAVTDFAATTGKKLLP
ncbi:hypothetical protein [Microbispora hainanensis]|uniref:Uncharacterized protein n=1 Tax=Microbispora hainanensis TaxID=568844 RepID=A0A544Z5Y7_9ACTN|nr:hypothetical protein [Microbispora hainanensis]TQS24321.1 hypothetical protein FLX08_01110 [Microbispora hainanensis]